MTEYHENKQIAVYNQPSIFLDMKAFEDSQRVAKALSTSTLLPVHFQGQNNLGNVLIALDYARNLGANPFMVMNNMYIVHGRPGLEAKLVIAMINNSDLFDGMLEFDDDGNKCTAWAIEKKTGIKRYGPSVDMEMARKEGWLNKSGSKWQTMPELMRMYRSATFFARKYCNHLLLGMHTTDEIYDMDPIPMHQTKRGTFEKKLGEGEAVIVFGDEEEVVNIKEQEAVKEPEPGEYVDNNGNVGLEGDADIVSIPETNVNMGENSVDKDDLDPTIGKVVKKDDPTDPEKEKTKVPALDDLIKKAQEFMPTADKKNVIEKVKAWVKHQTGKQFSSLSDMGKRDVSHDFDNKKYGFEAFINPKSEAPKPPTEDEMIAKIQEMYPKEGKDIGKVKRNFFRWAAEHFKGKSYDMLSESGKIDAAALFDDSQNGFNAMIEKDGWGR